MADSTRSFLTICFLTTPLGKSVIDAGIILHSRSSHFHLTEMLKVESVKVFAEKIESTVQKINGISGLD